MKELILWREVDVKDELPEKTFEEYIIKTEKGNLHEALLDEGEWFLNIDDCWRKVVVTHWLKRVVIPILSDQEIEEAANEETFCLELDMEGEYPKGFQSGYKLSQERLIGGQGL